MRKFILRVGPNLGRYYFVLMLVILLLIQLTVPVFAVDDMWTVANRIIKDVYSKWFSEPQPCKRL